MIEAMGIPTDLSAYKKKKKRTLRCVAYVFIATFRMKNLQADWAQSLKVKEKLVASLIKTKGRATRTIRA